MWYIFKWKTTTKEKFPQGIIAEVHESGWKTEDLVEDWMKSIRFCGFNIQEHCYTCDPCWL
jgi:hypothetical protein